MMSVMAAAVVMAMVVAVAVVALLLLLLLSKRSSTRPMGSLSTVRRSMLGKPMLPPTRATTR